MLDRKFIGMRLPERCVEIEKGQLRLFAKATGETDAVCHDERAAREAGHPGIPAPPTFAFCLEELMPTGWLETLGADTSRMLHGEQDFEYFAPMYAGDTITLKGRIADIYDKKGGALEFLVREVEAFNDSGVLCVRQRTVMVVRNA